MNMKSILKGIVLRAALRNPGDLTMEQIAAAAHGVSGMLVALVLARREAGDE